MITTKWCIQVSLCHDHISLARTHSEAKPSALLLKAHLWKAIWLKKKQQWGYVHLNSSISQLFPHLVHKVYVTCCGICRCSLLASAAARFEFIPCGPVPICVFMPGSGLGAGVRGGDYLACLPSGALRVCVFVQHWSWLGVRPPREGKCV